MKMTMNSQRSLGRALGTVALLATLGLSSLNALASELTPGEVRKIDREALKITLRHGEIRKLDMPPMTMVFQVRDEKQLERLKVGDKVLFAAEKSAGGAYVVTELQSAAP